VTGLASGTPAREKDDDCKSGGCEILPPEARRSAMVLSEEERRRLEELERDLTEDDPVLAQELGSGIAEKDAVPVAVLSIVSAVAGLSYSSSLA
jgi:hypothetical protein